MTLVISWGLVSYYFILFINSILSSAHKMFYGSIVFSTIALIIVLRIFLYEFEGFTFKKMFFFLILEMIWGLFLIYDTQFRVSQR